MLIDLLSRFPYAFDENFVSLTSVLISIQREKERKSERYTYEMTTGRTALVIPENWHTIETSKERKLENSEMFGTVQKIWEIEIGGVITDDNIRINLPNKIAPCGKQLILLVERHGVGADNVRAGVENHDIPDKWLGLSLNCNHGCDLDDGINLGLGEDTLTTSALNIETQNPEGGNLGPVSFRVVTDNLFVADLDVDLGI